MAAVKKVSISMCWIWILCLTSMLSTSSSTPTSLATGHLVTESSQSTDSFEESVTSYEVDSELCSSEKPISELKSLSGTGHPSCLGKDHDIDYWIKICLCSVEHNHSCPKCDNKTSGSSSTKMHTTLASTSNIALKSHTDTIKGYVTRSLKSGDELDGSGAGLHTSGKLIRNITSSNSNFIRLG